MRSVSWGQRQMSAPGPPPAPQSGVVPTSTSCVWLMSAQVKLAAASGEATQTVATASRQAIDRSRLAAGWRHRKAALNTDWGTFISDLPSPTGSVAPLAPRGIGGPGRSSLRDDESLQLKGPAKPRSVTLAARRVSLGSHKTSCRWRPKSDIEWRSRPLLDRYAGDPPALARLHHHSVEPEEGAGTASLAPPRRYAAAGSNQGSRRPNLVVRAAPTPMKVATVQHQVPT